MVQLIALIIFLVSLLAIFFILSRKIPALLVLPENGHHGIKKHKVIIKVEKKVRSWYVDFFEKQILLHRLLSKSRVYILKIERKIDMVLRGIRKKAQQLDKEIKKKK